MSSEKRIENFETELNFIYEDIENEFAKIVREGIKAILDEVEVFIVEITSSPSYKDGDPTQFVEVGLEHDTTTLKGKASVFNKTEIVLLDFKEKAKIIDQYNEN